MSRKGILFVAVLVLMGLANAGLGPLLSPLLYTLTPLQRHYLPAYIASSLKGSDPEARTEVEWVLKLRPKPAQPEPKPEGKPGRKSKKRSKPTAVETEHELRIAEERDVVAKPVGATVWAGRSVPFVLSAEAEREGWTGLDWSVPQQVESGKLRSMLRQGCFDGERWWTFFVQPALAAAALLMLGLLARVWFQGRGERHLWGPPRSRYDPLWRWMLQPPTPAWESPGQARRIEPSRPAPRQLEAPPLPKPVRRRAEAPAPAVPQRETVVLEENPRPVPAAANRPKKAYTWDESQGIE